MSRQTSCSLVTGVQTCALPICPAASVASATATPAPIASQAIGRAPATPASVRASHTLPATQKAIGKWTSIGCSGWPISRIAASGDPEGGAAEQHDPDHRDRGVDDHYQIGRAHVCTPVTNAHLVSRLL